jgi:hypothetical protein
VTYYRPVVAQDPTTGRAVTVLQPCTDYEYQARRQFSYFGSQNNPTCTNCAGGYGRGYVGPAPGMVAPPSSGPPAIPVVPTTPPPGAYGPPTDIGPIYAPPGTRGGAVYGGAPADRPPTLDPNGYRPGSTDVINPEGALDYGERRTEYRGNHGQYDASPARYEEDEYGVPDRDGWRDVRPSRPAARTSPRTETMRTGTDQDWRNADEQRDWRDERSDRRDAGEDAREYHGRVTIEDRPVGRQEVENKDAYDDYQTPRVRRRVPLESNSRPSATEREDRDGWRDVEPGYRGRSPSSSSSQGTIGEPVRKMPVPKPQTQLKPKLKPTIVKPKLEEATPEDNSNGPTMRGSRGQANWRAAPTPRSESVELPADVDSYTSNDRGLDVLSTRELPTTWEPRVNRPKVQPLRDDSIEKPRLPRMATPPLLNGDDKSARRLNDRDDRELASMAAPVWAIVKVDWNRHATRKPMPETTSIERIDNVEALPRGGRRGGQLVPIETHDDLETLAPATEQREVLSPVRKNKRGYDEQWQSMSGG